ncbi:MAG: hypothetical protein HY717_18560 [Planctomycetes bacterium]|nr:hypothetical protein [Planctomycetota bacterium]
MLLRIARRRTSAEEGLSLFVKVEFYPDGQPDLKLSTYEVGLHEVIRIRTEHYAGAELNPQGGPAFDFTGLHDRDPVPTPGNNPYFSFAKERHRELRFENEGELVSFASRLFGSLDNRTHEVSRQEMKDFFMGRLRNNDREWLRFFNATNNKTWKKWADEAMAPPTLPSTQSSAESVTATMHPDASQGTTKLPGFLLSAWKWFVSIFRRRPS